LIYDLQIEDRRSSFASQAMKRSRIVRVTFVAAGICAMVGGLSCPSGTVERATLPQRQDEPVKQDEVVLFLTGSELGALRPCGCSGGQLGGIEKRPAVFNSVPAAGRMVVETGSLVPSDREQDLMKFRILFEAFGRLNYDVVHLTGRDVEIAGRLGLLADPKPPFHVLRAGETGQRAVFTKQIAMDGREITVNVVSFDSPSAVLSPPAFALERQAARTVTILILDYDPGLVVGYPKELLYRSWVSPGAECVVCPSASDEPQVLSKPEETPLVCTVGRFGRFICRLGVTFGTEDGAPQAQDKHKAGSSDFRLQTSNFKLRFESIPVQEKLPDDPALVQLYRQYKQLVSQSGLLESHPRVPLPAGLAFAGSLSCKPCHEPAYDKWETTGHAHALDTLKKVGSDRDPECVICHVIGMEYESGFRTGETTPHLAGVGCENCHGPGSAHVLSAGQTATAEPKSVCMKCHTPEQSGHFAGHEEEFMKKIVHWKERATPGSVKK
jgi:hypothetical protein